MRYVALLRGINVGGNTMIKMEELRHTFEALNFENVVSYINSGNIAFDVSSPHVSKGTSTIEAKLIEKIESAIEKNFSKSIPVMIREQSDIARIIENNPFDGEFESHKEMHVLFMKDEMLADKQNLLLEQQTDSERFVVNGREIYCHLKLGVADSLLGKGFIDKKLKVPITGRNWRTVQKLAEL
jgi:uncharacterized protein (DUF1697 family)